MAALHLVVVDDGVLLVVVVRVQSARHGGVIVAGFLCYAFVVDGGEDRSRFSGVVAGSAAGACRVFLLLLTAPRFDRVVPFARRRLIVRTSGRWFP